ncbi:unnamed protein product [Arctogadus glacialis]
MDTCGLLTSDCFFSRVTKTDMELEIMRCTHRISSEANKMEMPAQHGGLLGFLCSAESHRELFDVLYRG